MKNVEWGVFNLEELFGKSTRGKRLKSEDRISGTLPFVTAGEKDEGISAFIGNDVTVFSENTITIDMFGSAKYRNYKYGCDDHIAVVHTQKLPKPVAIFITSAIHKKSYTGEFHYGRNFYAKDADTLNISLPTNNGKIDFKFMESFIAELEAERIAELEAYLLATGLKDYTLTDEEKQVLEDFENIKWGTFNLEKLFGKSTRGKRLKSADRISGNLPFVTAGETDEGISAFIGNDVNIFSKNTTTIDMFGSAKYRNYRYGGDDHIAVVHTEKLPKLASIFVTTAIHKSSYNGQFNYGRNFYAKDADELNISLPVKNNQPNYAIMETFISAIQKLVIKEVVLYADRKIAATKTVVNK
ncbi:MAG: restriction endonuclease subunit S [Microcystis sp. M040S2]|nr:restriction endonuclease subunit S [Microcystis sp. M099S2]MCA2648806.1 restriction endonuclease subunit S [Microcystis sp. M065S2]MCA2681742.1 restriction endonuclease subunit S [Microcystis sp. M043S2]MCA2695976.1 restriction endonuclease subunit S [Microcystis sp. M040S2]MCA2823771.1 restriction endonuclease subunit S [Microcystis sp. M088S1]MCA2830193.1 restriction endonuclease subunit S [Microcystis sp. M086S1]MCA2851253.1 restriction endonuclease subunit S [Microcystis sp. M076S1]MC